MVPKKSQHKLPSVMYMKYLQFDHNKIHCTRRSNTQNTMWHTLAHSVCVKVHYWDPNDKFGHFNFCAQLNGAIGHCILCLYAENPDSPWFYVLIWMTEFIVGIPVMSAHCCTSGILGFSCTALVYSLQYFKACRETELCTKTHVFVAFWGSTKVEAVEMIRLTYKLFCMMAESSEFGFESSSWILVMLVMVFVS